MWLVVFVIIILSCACVAFGTIIILEALKTKDKFSGAALIFLGIVSLMAMSICLYIEGRDSIINSKVCTNCSCFYEEEEKFCPECGEELTFVISNKGKGGD